MLSKILVCVLLNVVLKCSHLFLVEILWKSELIGNFNCTLLSKGNISICRCKYLYLNVLTLVL